MRIRYIVIAVVAMAGLFFISRMFMGNAPTENMDPSELPVIAALDSPEKVIPTEGDAGNTSEQENTIYSLLDEGDEADMDEMPLIDQAQLEALDAEVALDESEAEDITAESLIDDVDSAVDRAEVEDNISQMSVELNPAEEEPEIELVVEAEPQPQLETEIEESEETAPASSSYSAFSTEKVDTDDMETIEIEEKVAVAVTPEPTMSVENVPTPSEKPRELALMKQPQREPFEPVSTYSAREEEVAQKRIVEEKLVVRNVLDTTDNVSPVFEPSERTAPAIDTAALDPYKETDPSADLYPQRVRRMNESGESPTVVRETVQTVSVNPGQNNIFFPDANGTRFVQLASLPSQDMAYKAWDNLKATYGGLLDKLQMRMTSATIGGRGTFFRVQAGPLSEENARGLCAELTILEKPGGCLVVNR